MIVLAAIVLAALFLKDNQLARAVLRDDFRRDFGARDHRGSDGHLAVFAQHQNFRQLDGLSGFSGKLFDLNGITLGNFVLLAAGLYDCEHFKPAILNVNDNRAAPYGFRPVEAALLPDSAPLVNKTIGAKRKSPSLPFLL